MERINKVSTMKILICCNSFKNFTGSEVSVLELSNELINQGHDVTVVAATIGNPLQDKCKARVLNFMPDEPFDILHLNHKPISEQVLLKYPNTPAVMHVRSEVIPIFEVPIIHDNIKYYFSIRPTITSYIQSYGIPLKQIVEVNNGFDTKRFNMNYEFKPQEKETVLFVGTIDYLRINMLWDLVNFTKKTNKELWIIGNGNCSQFYNQSHVKCLGVKENVEDYIKQVDYTAGIFHGRTTIEGWLCDVPCWVYNVDKQGNILSKRLEEVPSDVEKYSVETSTKKIIEIYNKVLCI